MPDVELSTCSRSRSSPCSRRSPSAWRRPCGSAAWASGPGLIAVTLSATSLGLVVPVLKDAGRIESRFGQTTVAAASIADFADFAEIVLLSLLFTTSDTSTGSRLLLIGTFALLVAATAVAVSVVSSSNRLGMTLTRLQDTTAEIRVRGAVVILVAFVALAEAFGLESILGAFMAGAVVGIVDKNTASHPHFRLKLEAIGYGLLIPVFFVSSGLRLDLGGLIENPGALVRVPVFLLARCCWCAAARRCSSAGSSTVAPSSRRACSRRPRCRSS